MSIARRGQQWGTFSRVWHIFDAKWQDPFESAKLVKHYLMGLYKPIYHPLNDCGDHVIVINSKHIAMRGDDWTKRVYFHHTTYHRGASWTLAWELHNLNPTLVIQKAVYNAMDGNLQRRHTMQRLHIFPESLVPELMMGNVSNQIRQQRPVPVRLDHMPDTDVNNFPKIISYIHNDVKPPTPEPKARKLTAEMQLDVKPSPAVVKAKSSSSKKKDSRKK